MMGEDDEFLRPMVHAVIQEFLEAEQARSVGVQKGGNESKGDSATAVATTPVAW